MLDTGLLHQLRPVCALRPSALLRLTLDGSLKDLTIQVKSSPLFAACRAVIKGLWLKLMAGAAVIPV